MNRITALKRHIVVLTAAGGLVLGWAAAQSYAAEPCPLPESSTAEAGSTSIEAKPGDKPDDNSPPGPPEQGQAVLHNGFILCLPPSAAEAHIRHGDTPQGPCDKHGRVK